jgi:precorrin-3B synthase
VVTRWRGLLVPDLPATTEATAGAIIEALTAAGLVADEGSPWLGVTACAGLRCARGTADTELVARQVVAASGRSPLLPVHVVACPRACGRPSRRHVLATAGRGGVEMRCGDKIDIDLGDRAAARIAAARAPEGP